MSDLRDLDDELGMMRALGERNGRPVSVSLIQTDVQPDRWREVLHRLEDFARDGVDMKAQVAARPVGLLLSLEGSMNPFMLCPTYAALAHLPLAERVAGDARAGH